MWSEDLCNRFAIMFLRAISLRRRKCGVTHGELGMSARWVAAEILLVHIRLPRHYAAVFMCMQYILRASPESIIAIMPLMIFAQLSPAVMQWAVTRRTSRLCCCCVSPPLGGAPINCDDLRFCVCDSLSPSPSSDFICAGARQDRRAAGRNFHNEIFNECNMEEAETHSNICTCILEFLQ